MAREEPGYDAFISYSHRRDAIITARLQTGLQRFARPWYRGRALRVFRDETSLAASPHLWASIEEALGQSRWMILMASPDSAHSEWVAKEIAWWRKHRQINHLLIALTDGELVWDQRAGDLDWSATTALSRDALRQTFHQEPRWVDLRWARHPDGTLQAADPRLLGAVADLAAAIRHVPKDSIIGEHLRQRRRTLRAAISAVTALVVLLAASVTAAIVAKNQSDAAALHERIAEARQLAATAKTLTGSRLDLAQLFAARAYQLYPDSQTRSALFDVVNSDPHLVRFLPAGSYVTATAGSGDGRTVVSGTAAGQVQSWNLRQARKTLIASFPGDEVTSVAVSNHGDVVAASAGSAAVWARSGRSRTMHWPNGMRSTAAGVSPSGRFIAFAVKAAGRPIYFVVLNDRNSGKSVVRRVDNFKEITGISVPDDSQLVLFSREDGTWERLALPGLHRLAAQHQHFARASYQDMAISPDGSDIAIEQELSGISVYRTRVPTGQPAARARTSPENIFAVALSSGGHRVAYEDYNSVYVTGGAADGTPAPAPVILRGSEEPNLYTLAFFGAGDHRLLSASGGVVVVWDLTQYSRIGRQVPISIPGWINTDPHFSPPLIAASGASKTAAIVAGDGNALIEVRTGSSLGRTRLVSLGRYGHEFGPLALSHDGKRLYLLAPGSGSLEVRSADAGLPLIRRLRVTSAAAGGQPALAAVAVPGGKRIVLLEPAGNVRIISPVSGAPERVIGKPPGVKEGVPSVYSAAVDPAGRDAAIVGGDFSVHVIRIIRKHGENPYLAINDVVAEGVAYDGEHLLIQDSGGDLQVRSADGSQILRRIHIQPGIQVGPVASGTGMAAEITDGGAGIIADLTHKWIIGGFSVPDPRNRSIGLAFTPDGRRLLMVSENTRAGASELTELDMSPATWLRVACGTSGHRITAEDWRTYVSSAVPGNLRCGR